MLVDEVHISLVEQVAVPHVHGWLELVAEPSVVLHAAACDFMAHGHGRIIWAHMVLMWGHVVS